MIGLAVTAVLYLLDSQACTDSQMVLADFGASALIAAAIAAAVAGTATAAVGVANSISAKKNRKAAERTIGGLNAENSSNYYADYYRGALQNDAARAYLKRLDASMKKNNQALDNTIVSSGATHENALAQRQGRNAVVSDAMGNIVAAEDARRDRVRNNYFARKSQLDQAEMNSRQWYSQQKQQNRAAIASGIGQTASAIANLYGAGAFGGGGGGMTMNDYRNYQSQTLKTNGMTRPQVNSAYRNNSVGYSGIAKSGSGYGPSVGLKPNGTR